MLGLEVTVNAVSQTSPSYGDRVWLRRAGAAGGETDAIDLEGEGERLVDWGR
jgi:hypothetical protein